MRYHRFTMTALVLLAFLAIPMQLFGQDVPPEIGYSMPSSNPNPDQRYFDPQTRGAAPELLTRYETAADDPSKTCTVVTFEGLGNNVPIPDIEGIQSPLWLSLIDFDAGGSGNFAFEPTPSTTAYWLGGANSRDLIFENPASEVSFFYSSSVPVSMVAFDAANVQVGSVNGPVSWDPEFDPDLPDRGDPNGDYNVWTELKVTTTGNKIKRVRVTAQENQMGIDNLRVCTSVSIHSIEFTQAIQEWQTLDELKADLSDGKPPVPIIAGKPLAMRIYLDKVRSAVTVRINVNGVNQTVTLQPQCTPEDRRRQRNGCLSVDFYFSNPPSGNMQTTTTVFVGATQVQQEVLTLTNQNAEPLVLGAVGVCDATNAMGNWQCQGAGGLGGLIGVLRRIAPTHSVTVSNNGDQVRRRCDANNNGTITAAETDAFEAGVAADVAALHGIGDWFNDLFGFSDKRYFGLIRPASCGGSATAGTGGMASDIPGNGAWGRATVTRLGTNATTEVVAHETGHMLGARHVTVEPAAVGAPPGCYNVSGDPGTDWPYADPTIQEVGFDVAARRALNPAENYDIMSYCVPRWISPHNYRKMYTTALGALVEGRDLQDARTVVQGDFWTIGGSIVGGNVTFLPIYALNTAGENASGTGTHRIEVRNAGGTVLFTRFFTPSVAESESGDDDQESNPYFYELVPVQAGAASIRVFNAPTGGTQIGIINITGAPPTVTITAPTGGTQSGNQTVSWNVSDPNGGTHTYWVQYSPSNGAFGSWQTLVQNWTQTSININFNEIAGANGTARIRVLASDGVNSGIGVSNAFTVPSHLPTAEITDPAVNIAAKVGDLVWLQGYGFDYDEGFLSGAALSWSSNLQGVLGTGESLPLTNLIAGVHTITLTATDANNNTATDTIQVTIDGINPELTVYVTADGTPAVCVAVFIDAVDPPFSSGFEYVRYTLNGGETWMNIPVSTLPLRFVTPGVGYFNLIVEALDKAGNLDVASQEYFVDQPCPDNLISNESFDDPIGSAFGNWAVYQVPNNTVTSRIENGVFEFYRHSDNEQGVVFQHSMWSTPAGYPLDVMVDFGNSSGVPKRITMILWDDNFADLRVCSFWLPANSPLRTYRMLTNNLLDWNNATLHFYAATADNTGWYRIHNVSLRYNEFVVRPQTLCLDPNAPLPVEGASDGAEMVTNGSFSVNQQPPFNAENQWGYYWTPQSDPVANHFAFQRNAGGWLEMYKKAPPPGVSNSGVILQYTQDTVTAGNVIEARFDLANSNSTERARVTVIIHPRNFDRDLGVCSFWLEPNTPTPRTYVMRIYTQRAWDTVGTDDASISFYASSNHTQGWTIIDNVSMRTRPSLGTVGAECYPPGSDIPGGVAAGEDWNAVIEPVLLPTATSIPYVAPNAPAEIPVIIAPNPTAEPPTDEGSISE